MRNLIRVPFLALFCLFSLCAMGMEHVYEIEKMQKGLEINSLQQDIIPSQNDLLAENSSSVRDNTERQSQIIASLPKDMWRHICSFLRGPDKLRLYPISKLFYYSLGQEIYFECCKLKIEKIFPDKNTTQLWDYSQNKFDVLLHSTQIIDDLSKDAYSPIVKDSATSHLKGYKNVSCLFLNGFKGAQGRDDLRRPTDTYKNYAYLCDVYQNDYDKVTCCTQLGLCCTDSWHSCGECCADGCVFLAACCCISGVTCYNGGAKCLKGCGKCCKFSGIGTAVCCACLWCWPCMLCCINDCTSFLFDDLFS